LFSPSAGRVTKNCDMQDFDLTAHANRNDLLEFVGQVSPRAILLGHGGDDSRRWFEEQIRSLLAEDQNPRAAAGKQI